MIILKKLNTLALALLLALSTVFTGCSGSTGNTIELQEGVKFELMDVLKITNPQTNAVYYYFLAGVTNSSKGDYHMSNLTYNVSDGGGENAQSINPIDKFQSLITNDLHPNQSTSVYGYIGFPDSKEKNCGLYFPKEKKFIPFTSVKVREINDEKVVNSMDKKYMLYEDEYFSMEVDSSNISYSYSDGTSKVEGLVITYTNKTKEMLVVPYITPIGKIEGLELKNLKNADKLKKMSLEELKKQDFSENGLPPKTTSIQGESLGYKLYYLPADISVPCNISIEFQDAIPDFKSTSTAGGVTIQLKSPSLGYSQIIKVEP